MDDAFSVKLKIIGFVAFLPVVMLILCLWSWPYFYYIILRRIAPYRYIPGDRDNLPIYLIDI